MNLMEEPGGVTRHDLRMNWSGGMTIDIWDEAERSRNPMTASSQLETEYCRDKEKDGNCHLLLPYMDCASEVGECITATPILRSDHLREGTRRNGRPAEVGREISISDLVWCKIRGPYWWPGKLIGCSAGVMKDYFLVACFGNRARGHDRVSLVKPLWEHFPLMETQSSSGKLRRAVDCALDELSRRMEYVLTCQCVPREVQTRFKARAEVNAASVKNSSQCGVEDSVLNTASFTPGELVKYIKTWSESPHSGPSRLLLSVAKSQLLAFSRWKGVSWLPEFISFGGKLENEANMTPLGDCCQNPIGIDGSNPEFEGCNGMLTVKTGCYTSDSSFQDSVHPGRKRKTRLALRAENCPHTSTDEVGSSKRVRGNSFSFGKAAGLNELVSPCTGALTTISADQSVNMFEQNHMATLEVQRKTECHISNSNKLKRISPDDTHPGRKRKICLALCAENCPRTSTDKVGSSTRARGNSFLLGKAASLHEMVSPCTGTLMTISTDQSVHMFEQSHMAMLEVQRKTEYHISNSNDLKHISLDDVHPGRKRKSFPVSSAKNCQAMLTDEVRSDKGACGNSIGKASGPNKSVSACASAPITTSADQSMLFKKNHRAMHKINKVESESNGSLPLAEHLKESTSVKSNRNTHSGLIPLDSCSRYNPLGYVSPRQMLLRLCLLASNPMRQNRFPTCTVRYFSEFRNLVVPDHLLLKSCGESAQEASAVKTQNTLTNFGVAKPMDLKCFKDSVRTGMIIHSIQEPRLSLENCNAGESLLETPCERPVPFMVSRMDHQFLPASNQDPRLPHDNPLMEGKKTVHDVSGPRIEYSKDPFSSSRTIQRIPVQQPLLGNQSAGDSFIGSEGPIPSVEPHIGQFRRIGKLQVRRPNPYMIVKQPNNDIPATVHEYSKDSLMSSRIMQSIPEPQLSLGNQIAGDSLLKAPCKNPVPSMEPQTDRQYHPVLIWKSQAPFQDPYMEAKCPSDDVSGAAVECSQDTFITARITQSVPQQKVLLKDEEDMGNSVLENPSKKPAHLTEPQINHQFGPASIQEAQFPFENPYVEVKKPDGDVPGSSKEDYFSTALILTFTNLDLAPSVTKLNKMFSCFGPLEESESKVLNKSKQVKIVFKNRADAETAFIRLGEHRMFGSLLRSYRLKYVRSCSLEASPSQLRRHTKKRLQDEL